MNGGREGLRQRFRKWIEGVWNEWQREVIKGVAAWNMRDGSVDK